MQKLGLLHAHPVLAYFTASEKGGRYVKHLDELRHRWGFGYVARKWRVREPRAAGGYISSYFINGKGDKASLEESIRSTGDATLVVTVPRANGAASLSTCRSRLRG